MIESILTSVKKNLGLAEDYEYFDPDVIMHINAVFATLNQLGVGPETGFAIEDKTTVWDDFIGNDPRKSNVKTFTYLSVRLAFDPPTTSFGITMMQDQIRELAWRINVYRESYAYVNPDSNTIEGDIVLDGEGP